MAGAKQVRAGLAIFLLVTLSAPRPAVSVIDGDTIDVRGERVRVANLDAPARALLPKAAEAAGLTARGWTRTLRLARTIADLEGAADVRRVHLAEALIYRRVGLETASALSG